MLHLRCISKNTATYTDYHLLPVIFAHLHGPDPIEYKSLNVTLNHRNRSLEVAASTSLPISRFNKSQDFESHMDGHNELVLSFGGLPEIGNWTNIIEQVCNRIPISDLEFLSISAPDVIDLVNFVELFKRCTKVTMMQAIGRGTSGLVRSLAAPKVATKVAQKVAPNIAPEVAPKVRNNRYAYRPPLPNRKYRKKKGRDNRDSTPAQPASSSSTAAQPARSSAAQVRIFPELAFISLKGLGFAEIECPTGIVFDMVERALRQRMVTYKAPVKMLCIDNCAISTKRARALQQLVQEFHWDKEERFLDEIDDSDDYYSEFDDYSSGI